MRKPLTIFAIVAATIATVIYLLLMFATGPLSNGILANAVGPEDFELPPTYYPMSFAAEDVQVVGGQAAGLDCSLPWGISPVAFPRRGGAANIALQMRQACVNHDYCYRHGNATYALSQAECDFMLQEQAFRLCSQINAMKGIPTCETEARKVTLGVRVGGAGSFRRADSLQDPSTYFEYDPNPTAAKEFTILRVADTPLIDAAADFEPKALYRFRVRQSGALLRIVAFRKKGGTACIEFAFPGRFGSITSLPSVSREGVGTEWLIWWQRDREDTTGGGVDGIAPGRATLSEWIMLGAVTGPGYGDPSCSLRILEANPVIPAGSAAFANVRFENRFGQSGDGLVPEFHPIQSKEPSTAAGELVLLGLTSHGCSKDAKDQSTCVGRLSVDTLAGNASFEPFRTLDPNCRGDNRQSWCDRYRNYAAHPLVLKRDGTVGLAWLRRGFSTAFSYSDGATLRWAPIRSPVNDQPNYVEWDIDLAERDEPVALASKGNVNQLVSLHKNSSCKHGLAVTRFRLEATDRHPQADEKCLADLTDEWVARPYFVVDRRKIVFVQGGFQEGADATERSFTVQSLTVDLESLVVSQPEEPREAFRVRICRTKRGDATAFLALSNCESPSSRFGRIRQDGDIAKTLARLANRTAIVPATIGADGKISLVIVAPAEFGAVAKLDGEGQ